ncbi:MAG: MBL fold metallo-hydrolase [Hyphomonadaceae bacterium]|nr:MBL fold metallo-hydrolase [Hyphomonadaceae bacterium]
MCGLALGLAASSCQSVDFTKPAEQAAPSAVAAELDFTVTILGSGTPIASRTQVGAAILVKAGSQTLLFDCGRGCTSRLAQYDLSLGPQIDKLFLTHLHSDHIVGIPDLWLNGWTQGRQGPLRIWGPEGTYDMLESLRKAFAADLSYRNAGPDKPAPPALENHVTRIPEQGGVVFQTGGVTVTAFPVIHARIQAYGFRIDYAGKSVLISGDTSATPNLATYGAGADLALLEVVSPAMEEALRQAYPAAMVEMILRLHLTPEQAGQTLAEIAPELGVYYHTVTGCESDKALLETTGKYHRGSVIVASDLTEIRLMPTGIETHQFLLNEIECR